MKRPASQFYWGDWLNCTELRVCSLAARGLWIDMLAHMRQGSPLGTLTNADGRPITIEQLARLVGDSIPTVRKLLAELDNAGVPGKREDGAYYSRRMMREESSYRQYCAEASEAGKEGANARWGKGPKGDGSPTKPSPNRDGNHGVPHDSRTGYPTKNDGVSRRNLDAKHDSSSSSPSSVRTIRNSSVPVPPDVEHTADAACTLTRVENPSQPESGEGVKQWWIRHNRKRAREKPTIFHIARIARDVIEANPTETDDGHLRHMIKQACSQLGWPYNGHTIGKALDIAKGQNASGRMHDRRGA